MSFFNVRCVQLGMMVKCDLKVSYHLIAPCSLTWSSDEGVFTPAAVTEDRERCGAAGGAPVAGRQPPLPSCHPSRPRAALHPAPLPLPRPPAAGVLRRGELEECFSGAFLSLQVEKIQIHMIFVILVVSELPPTPHAGATVPLPAATATFALPPQPPALLPVSTSGKGTCWNFV